MLERGTEVKPVRDLQVKLLFPMAISELGDVPFLSPRLSASLIFSVCLKSHNWLSEMIVDGGLDSTDTEKSCQPKPW